ncbi:hypothetical protein SEUCBS139899_005215 [Sporothrix eucalyptigena]|uniref:Uncharacterized protein n=1 Tax=Sporothrix eucalyptigena TaxID=1812306 RepID=A0ABP0BIC3_9PEZI
MFSSTTSPSLLLWTTVFVAAFGSAAVVHASPSLADDVAAAAGGPAVALLRFSPNTNKQLDITERSSGNDPDRPDLAAANVLMPRAATNLQFFQGALANIAAPAISQSNDVTRPFEVDGDTFTNFEDAINRSCDNQHNSCADAANSQKSSSFTVGDCDTQDTQCKAAASSATQTAFTQLTSSTSEFDIYCDV